MAKHAIGDRDALFVDANGAYRAQQALEFANEFARSSEVALVRGAGLVRRSDGLAATFGERAPVGMEIAAGEYGYTVDYVRRMLEAEAVDVQQADMTRCGGVTGFLQVARALRGVSHRPVRPLRTGAASARGLRRHRGCGIWNGFTITSASSTCCSTARPSRRRRDPARPVAPGNGLAFQATRRGALRGIGNSHDAELTW